MIIGKFTSNGEGGYIGAIYALGHTQDDVALRLVLPRVGKMPDFAVWAHSDDDSCEIGVAWKRRSGRTDKAYLSVKLDSPFLTAPINCALVEQNGDAGEFALVWNRRRRGDDAPAE